MTQTNNDKQIEKVVKESTSYCVNCGEDITPEAEFAVKMALTSYKQELLDEVGREFDKKLVPHYMYQLATDNLRNIINKLKEK